MGQLQGTIQGGVILGRPPRGTPAAPIAQALFQALRAATNSLTAASEAACPYDNSPVCVLVSLILSLPLSPLLSLSALPPLPWMGCCSKHGQLRGFP